MRAFRTRMMKTGHQGRKADTIATAGIRVLVSTADGEPDKIDAEPKNAKLFGIEKTDAGWVVIVKTFQRYKITRIVVSPPMREQDAEARAIELNGRLKPNYQEMDE